MAWEHRITPLICPKCGAQGQERYSSNDWNQEEHAISRDFHWVRCYGALGESTIKHECGEIAAQGKWYWE